MDLHPGKVHTESDGMDLWKTTFLYKPVVFRFHGSHVNLPECIFGVGSLLEDI